MEINVKDEHEYKIEGPVHESDLLKIEKILQDTFYQKIEASVIANGYYILKLNTTQLTYILNYFLKKEGK